MTFGGYYYENQFSAMKGCRALTFAFLLLSVY